MLVHGHHYLFQRVRAGHGEDLRMRVAHHVALGAQTSGDDHPAVFRDRFADRVKRFLHRRLDEAAGIHHDEIGPVVRGGDRVAFGAQPGEDALRVDQRLGTAEGYEPDLRYR